jgi:multiple sugar transport system ATP-binding protein
MAMAQIVLDGVDKMYAGGVKAVNDLSLEILDGEFMVLVGPSGCGKSTALRMIAGLEDVTRGTIQIGDRVVNNLPPKDRDIAMVFQNYALYPQMTVAQNLAFGLQMRKTPKRDIARRVQDAAKILGLEPYLARKPAALSGGQRQRVAMGRAIVREPQAFLMDEPLSNLDAKLRSQMRSEIAQLQDRLGVTTIYVTHDQVEAMTMGDRVALLRDGVLQQVDTPANIYDRPANTFVAAFIGSPSMNLFRASVEKRAEGGLMQLGTHSLRLPASVFEERPRLGEGTETEIIVGLRPEVMHDAALRPGHPEDMCMTVPVFLTESLGSDCNVHFALDAAPAKVVDPDTLERIVPEDTSGVAIARFSARSKVRSGAPVSVAVECDRLHFFDLQRGEAI